MRAHAPPCTPSSSSRADTPGGVGDQIPSVTLSDGGRAWAHCTASQDHFGLACVRCPVLQVDPKMLPRLDELKEDFVARRGRAEHEGWLGEIEGINLTLASCGQGASRPSGTAAPPSPSASPLGPEPRSSSLVRVTRATRSDFFSRSLRAGFRVRRHQWPCGTAPASPRPVGGDPK